MINRVILVGRLTRDPEVRRSNSGTPVADIALATNSYRRGEGDSGERQEVTEYHDLVAWGRLAEVAEQYLRRGRLIYAEGKLQTRTWETKAGEKRKTTEIRLDTFQMLGPRSVSTEETEEAEPSAA
jgi:single-strand DNA-binding protein